VLACDTGNGQAKSAFEKNYHSTRREVMPTEKAAAPLVRDAGRALHAQRIRADPSARSQLFSYHIVLLNVFYPWQP
jgi:hypothetical protein